ncbi:MAG: peptidoglycan DD-metalloendopeptidase family protein [Anaerolineales bacterium]|nr:peptidoglycan DD-metalloendopeptidase family protein [Anaerolineales bacterium]
MKRRLIFWMIGLGLAVAVAFGVNAIPREPVSPTPGQADPVPETPTPSATVPEVSVYLPQTAEATLLPGQTPTPFRFVFPTQAAVPVSAWRPPLYAVPFALTEHDHFYFARPIGANERNWPDPNYRYGGVFFEGVTHSGVDIPAALGAPVLAAGSGKVVWAGYGFFSGPESPDDPYGLAVVVHHDFGYKGEDLFTLYAHMSQVDVIRGQYVTAGDQVGLVGETGFTTGVHLHFEVRIGENFFYRTTNPELWIAPPQGWGVLAARIMGTGGQLLPSQRFVIRNLDTGDSWVGITYGNLEGTNQDPYYQENVVVGDLPAGNYKIEISYLGVLWDWPLEIKPGQVSYFQFRGRNGFFNEVPPTPGPSPTPTP